MERKRIAVLFGGRSSEHDVSLETAAAFMERVDRTVYEVVPVWIERRVEHHGGRRASGADRAAA